MLNYILCTKNYSKVYHRKQVNASSNMKVVASLMHFECQPCGVFEGLSYHQEDEVINPIIFVATAGFGNRIKNLISTNFMEMMS